MKQRHVHITIITYIILLIVGLYYGYSGEILSYHWEFNFEKATLYTGNSMLKSNDIDALYIVWLFLLTLSFLHIFRKEVRSWKASLLISFALAGIFLVFPEVTLYVFAGPTIVANRLLSWIGVKVVSKAITIALVVGQAALVPIILEKIYSYPFTKKKQIDARKSLV